MCTDGTTLARIVLILATLLFFAASDAGPGEDLDRRLAEFEEKGASFAFLTARRGEIVLAGGYGPADRSRRVSIDTDTVFNVGSVTKQFTAAAILKLEEQGKLRVDDPITKFLDDVPEDKQAITIHHLLTHTSGLRGGLISMGGGDYLEVGREKFIGRAMASKLKSKPGEEFRYSNVGYSLLAAIIELVSGRSYESYLHDNLFKSAGMMQTGYLIPDWDRSKIAHGYIMGRDWGTPLDKPWAEDGPYWNLRGNGGVLSTVADLYKWSLALRSGAVLSEASREKLFTPYVAEDESGESYYCYGWTMRKTERGATVLEHNGSNGVFFADFRIYPGEDAVSIILSNGGPSFILKYMAGYGEEIEKIILD